MRIEVRTDEGDIVTVLYPDGESFDSTAVLAALVKGGKIDRMNKQVAALSNKPCRERHYR